MDNEVVVETIEIDNVKYTVLDKIDDKYTYIYLTNLDKRDDFIIQKFDESKENIISLDSEQEFSKALLLYVDKQMKIAHAN